MVIVSAEAFLQEDACATCEQAPRLTLLKARTWTRLKLLGLFKL